MKNFCKSASVFISFLFISMAFSCGVNDTNDPSGSDGTEEIDYSMSQLYVSNYNGGYGNEWLTRLKLEFENLYAETSFEQGKKGVQIIIDNNKSNETTISTLNKSRNEVFFASGAYYTNANQGKFLDITDIVTEGGENSIESKLNEQQRTYYSSIDGKYFALPRYEGYSGMMYDVDLFEEESLYFAKNGCPTEENYGGSYKYTSTGEKATGPDGVYGTSDDGLPATYDDMFVLFDLMVKKGIIPLTWTGWYNITYLGWFMDEMAADYDGAEQIFTQLNVSGSSSKVVSSITEQSQSLFDAVSLKPEMQITAENGYELYNTAGKYYSLKVMEKILSDTKYYDIENCFNTTVSHTDAQDNFLYGKYENKPIAIILEGTWWENEAKSTFEEMSDIKGAGRYERRLAVMPQPKVSKEQFGKATYLDNQNSLAFIKASIDENKIELAKTFYKFCFTEKAMREFTTITNTPLAFSYELTEEEYNSLSYFGQSTWDIHSGKTATVVYNVSSAEIYLKNESQLKYGAKFVSKVGDTTYNVPSDCFRKKQLTALEFFNGIQNYYSKNWWDNNISR